MSGWVYDQYGRGCRKYWHVGSIPRQRNRPTHNHRGSLVLRLEGNSLIFRSNIRMKLLQSGTSGPSYTHFYHHHLDYCVISKMSTGWLVLCITITIVRMRYGSY